MRYCREAQNVTGIPWPRYQSTLVGSYGIQFLAKVQLLGDRPKSSACGKSVAISRRV